jgi:hypothetical protein
MCKSKHSVQKRILGIKAGLERVKVEGSWASTQTCSRSGSCYRLPQQFRDFCFQHLTLLCPKPRNPERLQKAVRAPHWKQHFGARAQQAAAKHYRQVYFGALLKIRRDFQQPSRDRELMELARELTSIFEHKSDRDSALQADACSACSTTHSRGVRHAGSTISSATMPPVAGSSSASNSSRTRMQPRNPGIFDNDGHLRRCAATRTGVCTLVQKAALRISMGRPLVAVLPMIEPTREERFVLVVQQVA